jgi:hypothetical protein
MFSYPIAKAVWGVVAICFGQNTGPSSYEQSGGGLAAICWPIWKDRNSACFEKKNIKNPVDIIFSACSFMRY